MSKSLARIIFAISALALFGAGCISFGGDKSSGGDGGVFKSTDQGEQWAQASTIPTPQGIANFGSVNITAFEIDPQDHLAIYAGSDSVGMFYSYDGGASWQRPADLQRGFVAALRVDPENKCLIYVATTNRIMRSLDCSRTFQEIYREASAQTFITALSINPFNPKILYAGTVKGTLIKSRDGGITWSLEHAFSSRNKIVDIIVDPQNSSRRYIALQGKGLWVTDNDGATFTDLTEGLKIVKDGHDLRRLAFAEDTLFAVAKAKILSSKDKGMSWTALPIISPEAIEILSFAVNPKNAREIYYGTATTFYKSLDGGQSWSTKKLPTSRTATALLVDFQDPRAIYLGTTAIKK